MGYFSEASEVLAAEIIDRYPRPKSAVIPLLHLAQEQEGWVTREAMLQIADLTGVTAAEVLGTGSFYEMFRFHPVGRYMVNVCTNISCQLLGGEELLNHVESTLGVSAGDTTEDGMFTVEDVECVAACTEAPCFTVNYRYFHRATPEVFDQVVSDLRDGHSPVDRGSAGDSGVMPEHGILGRVRQEIPVDRMAGVVPPEQALEQPVWLPGPADVDADG